MKKAMVFSSIGLGDGLLFLILSYNLFESGYSVDTFHPFLHEMNNWYKFTEIRPYPELDPAQNEENVFNFLNEYDLIIINSDYNPLNKAILKFSKDKFPHKTYELHPSTCKGKGPSIGSMKFDFKKNIIQNFENFCKNILCLENFHPSNGICCSKELQYRKHQKRIIIHPMSKDIQRNWPKDKYAKLCLKLKKLGYEPSLILTDSEKKYFEDLEFEKPKFNNLNEMAAYIYESAFMIGNDSGIGHLASNLKIPTITLFATKRKAIFWKPNFFIGKTIAPFPLINIKGLRLREKYWKATISVRNVLNKFKKLVVEFEKRNSCNI
ncbi:MAG: glycosyltransferase family 9 protein [Parachlamydiales bacterium]